MDLNKSFLLPHKWQIVGGWLLIAYVIGDILFVFNQISAICGIYPMMMWIVLYIAIMLLCLSKEKNDDEYIRSLRSRLAIIVIALAFIVSIIGQTLDLYAIHYARNLITWRCNLLVYFISNPVFYGIFYIVALKLNLWIINRKMKKNAE